MTETHELEIRFAEGDARSKREVLARLERLGVTSFAEGVIDGVDLAIEDERKEPDFEGDWTPILVFDEDPARLQALEEDLAARCRGRVTFRRAALSNESWRAAWDEGEELITTRRYIVWPEGRPGEPPGGLAVLRIFPGEAFGSGRHATTQAALEALESLPADLPRGPVLDVGTGTGILLIAADRLGFGPHAGTEIDDVVIAEARRNLELNGVEASLENRADPRGGERYALVVANILVPVLHHLMPRFAELLRPGGRVVLAGFVDKEAGPLIAAAARHGLVEESRRACRGWLGLVLKAR